MKNEKHREQIADLILTDSDGGDLEIVSPLEQGGKSMSFEIGSFKTKERFKVVITIEEL
jgi:hypothetical protein